MSVVDLGRQHRRAQSFLTAERARRCRSRPIRCTCGVCEACLLLQIPALVTAGGDVHRVRVLLVVLGQLGTATRSQYVDDAAGPSAASGSDSFVVEVASNDGYLLQHVRSPGAYRAWASNRR